MEGKVLEAKPRTTKGKNSNRKLRTEGLIPAVMYSHGTAEAIQIKEKDFFQLFKGHISESVIFDLKVEGSTDDQMAFVKDYKKDPVSGKIIHLDFFRVTKGEKINTIVPIELVGSPKGVKSGGVLNVGERSIEVECMPRNLPEIVTVDISGLDVGDLIHTGDIKLPEGVELYSNAEAVIVSVDVPRTAEEVEENLDTTADADTDAAEETPAEE